MVAFAKRTRTELEPEHEQSSEKIEA